MKKTSKLKLERHTLQRLDATDLRGVAGAQAGTVWMCPTLISCGACGTILTMPQTQTCNSCTCPSVCDYC